MVMAMRQDLMDNGQKEQSQDYESNLPRDFHMNRLLKRPRFVNEKQHQSRGHGRLDKRRVFGYNTK
jgi:hypothetical protein